MEKLVGAPRFELGTPCTLESPSRPHTKSRRAPCPNVSPDSIRCSALVTLTRSPVDTAVRSRWVCAGTFPPKRAGGGRGWLRSDVERWLGGVGVNQRQTALASGRAPNNAP